MNANELADGVLPALWANPKTEIHGIVDVRTYPLKGFIPLCVKQDADTMLRQLQAENETIKTQYEELKRAYMILSGKLSDLSCGGGAYSSRCCCNKQQLGGGGAK